MNKCETCKHRGDDPIESESRSTTYYECKRIEHGNECSRKDEFKSGEKALALDGSGYRAQLAVENDFGCVLWEAK